MLGGMCLSVVLVACGGGGGGGTEPEPESVQSPNPGNPTAPPPTSPPPSPPPQSSAKLQPAWQTIQGNAAHTGHVPVQLGQSRPVVAWEWPATADDASPAINPVVTGNGAVYVATEARYCTATLHALDGLSGAVRWSREFAGTCNFNPPAVSGDRVYVATTGHGSAMLRALRTDNGEQIFGSPFDNQWYELLAPTVYDNAIYTNGGLDGGVYAFDRAGSRLWNGATADTEVYAPAVDQTHVFHYSGTSLEIWERATGRHLGSILDTAASGNFASYEGAAIIGGHGNVIVRSRSAGGRVLSSFNVGSRQREWATSRTYDTDPAVADGIVYAASNDGMRVDAIDETNGAVLWSWSPASGQGDSVFLHNIIVTDDVLLVSTDAAVHAVDLATRQSIWRHDQPGQLALSGHFLFITTGGDASDGRLVALDLSGTGGQVTAAATHRQKLGSGSAPEVGSGSAPQVGSGGSALQVIGGAAIAGRLKASSDESR